MPRARVLADRADLLETLKKQPKEALDARLAAIELAPDWTAQIEAARASGKQQGQSARVADALRTLIERSTRRKEDAPLASDLLMHLADILEHDVSDLAGAARPTRASRCSGFVPSMHGARSAASAAARGDRIEEIRVLRRLVAAGVDTSSLGRPEDDIPESAKTDALYRIAEVSFATQRRCRAASIRSPMPSRVTETTRARPSRRPMQRRTFRPTHAPASTTGSRRLWSARRARPADKSLLLGYLKERIGGEGASIEDVREHRKSRPSSGAVPTPRRCSCAARRSRGARWTDSPAHCGFRPRSPSGVASG